MIEVTKQTARRFLLGRSGLWPGRRWAAKEGTAAAARSLGAVQIDPLNVAGRNHDLVLQARVADYQPEHLDELAYADRRFFDYGGTLFLYPMEELPYWRLHMQRQGNTPRWKQVAQDHADALAAVRAELRARGPLGNRDFAGTVRVNSYRGSKDTGLALYYLWITGELMTHSRRNFQRLFGFREAIAPPFDGEIDEAEIESYFARKSLDRHGLTSVGDWAGSMGYYLGTRSYLISGGGRAVARRKLDQLVDEGIAVHVSVEGIKEPYYAPAESLNPLHDLSAGRTPDAWRPLDSTTGDEVSFIAPLDDIMHRQRANQIFDFEYIWEVYKPAPQRRWGYYTLPVLWHDQLVARIDPKLDRTTRTLTINGFWMEDAALPDNPAFAQAFARGLARFMRYCGATRVDCNQSLPASVESAVRSYT
ncbi:MAG: winged helix-turn-helix domain-containing protein [Dehalococcoidia bacterium]